MEKKRNRYKKPVLEELNVIAQGAVECDPNGSVATGICSPGGVPAGTCAAGGTK